jgi:hypothetical protein
MHPHSFLCSRSRKSVLTFAVNFSLEIRTVPRKLSASPAGNGQLPKDDAPNLRVVPAEPAPPPSPPPATPADPVASPVNLFSRDALRLDSNHAAQLRTSTHQHVIPIGRPPSELFFRVSSDPDFTFDSYILDIKNGPDRGTYQIASHLWPLLATHKCLKPMRLVLCVVRPDNDLRIWPIRLPRPDGRTDDWMDSELTISEIAKGRWVQIQAGDYGFKHVETPAVIPDPVWPTKTFDELLDTAFRKKRISSEDDPVLRRLLTGA